MEVEENYANQLAKLKKCSENLSVPAKNTNLELEGLQEHLELPEKAIERANLRLESIEISINEQKSEPPSEAGSKYTPSLQFEQTNGHGSPLHVGEGERRARMMDRQVKQAKREAQRRLEEERKRVENLKQERQLQEYHRIRELEYKVKDCDQKLSLTFLRKIKEYIEYIKRIY